MINTRQEVATDWDTITALGDGSCAFNAFILGIKQVADSLHQNADEKYKTFLQAFAAQTNRAASWVAFKQYLLETNTKELQETLAPVFRQFAIKQLTEKAGLQGKLHQEKLLLVVKTEFRNVVLAKLGRPVPQNHFTRDDICARLSHITAEFEKRSADVAKNIKQASEAKSLSSLEEMQDQLIAEYQEHELKQWWNESGYTTAMQSLSQNGWAGDLELAPLAEYFGVHLDVQRQQGDVINAHTIHFDHGQFNNNAERLDNASIQRLTDVDVIEQISENQYRWKKVLEERELEQLLSAVEGGEVLQDFIGNCEADAVVNGLKNTPVRSIWKPEMIELLQHQGIVCINQSNILCFNDDEKNIRVKLSIPEHPSEQTYQTFTPTQRLVHDEIVRVKDKLQDRTLPDFLVPEQIAALRTRGVVKDNNGKAVFALGENSIQARISEIPNAERIKVIALWKNTRKICPVVTLINQSGNHWDLRVRKNETIQLVTPSVSSVTAATPNVESKPAPVSPKNKSQTMSDSDSNNAAGTKSKMSKTPVIWHEKDYVSTLETKGIVKKADATKDIASKWHQILAEVKKEVKNGELTKDLDLELEDKETLAIKKGTCEYSLSDSRTIKVDKPTQENLDAILAEKLQQEEYRKSCKR